MAFPQCNETPEMYGIIYDVISLDLARSSCLHFVLNCKAKEKR